MRALNGTKPCATVISLSRALRGRHRRTGICGRATFSKHFATRDQERGGTMTHLAFNTACSLVALLATSALAVADDVRAGSSAFGDWQTDAPGVTRKITVSDLPAPLATPPARNFSKVIPKPA